MPDTGCWDGPANVPVDVLSQSFIFKNANFNFDETEVVNTPYLPTPSNAPTSGLRLTATTTTLSSNRNSSPPLNVDVPADQGLSLNPDIFSPTLDSAVRGVEVNSRRAAVVAELANRKDVNPGNLSHVRALQRQYARGRTRKSRQLLHRGIRIY
jgi:hypothetical protein